MFNFDKIKLSYNNVVRDPRVFNGHAPRLYFYGHDHNVHIEKSGLLVLTFTRNLDLDDTLQVT